MEVICPKAKAGVRLTNRLYEVIEQEGNGLCLKGKLLSVRLLEVILKGEAHD